MSDTADPTVEKDFGQGVSDALVHAVNSATLGLPQGIANKSGPAMTINNLLLGLPQALIDAAGGRKALKETLARKGIGSTVGDIAGSVLPFVVGGPGTAVAKGIATLPKAARLAADIGLGTAMGTATKGMETGKITKEDVGSSALGSAIGSAAGASVGKLVGGLVRDADSNVLANVLGVGKREFRKLESNKVGPVRMASPETIAADKSAFADIARNNKIYGPDDVQKYFDAKVNPAYEALQRVGSSLNDPQTMSGIHALPEMQEALKLSATPDLMPEGAPTINALLDRARLGPSQNGATPLGYKENLAKLDGEITDIFRQLKAMNSGASISPKDTGLLPDYLKTMANALHAARDKMQEDAFSRLTPQQIQQFGFRNLDELKQAAKFKILMNDVLRRQAIAEATTTQEFNSKTGALQALMSGNPKAILALFAAGPINQAVVGASNAIAGRTGMVAPAIAGSQLGQALKPALMPGAAAAGGQMAGNAQTMERAQLGPQAAKPNRANPYSPDPEKRTRDNYIVSPFDSRIEEGIERGFNMMYSRVPDEQRPSYFRSFRKAALDMAHNADGTINITGLAGVLFPKQGDKQEVFEKTATSMQNIMQNIDDATRYRGDIWGQAQRFAQPTDPKSIAYNALRESIATLPVPNPKALQDEYDRIMAIPGGTPETRKKAILDMIRQNNQQGVQLMQSAGVNLW